MYTDIGMRESMKHEMSRITNTQYTHTHTHHRHHRHERHQRHYHTVFTTLDGINGNWLDVSTFWTWMLWMRIEIASLVPWLWTQHKRCYTIYVQSWKLTVNFRKQVNITLAFPLMMPFRFWTLALFAATFLQIRHDNDDCRDSVWIRRNNNTKRDEKQMRFKRKSQSRSLVTILCLPIVIPISRRAPSFWVESKKNCNRSKKQQEYPNQANC